MENYEAVFSDKGLGKNDITLFDDGKIISDDEDVANTLNTFFANVITNLDIRIPEEFIENTANISNPIKTITRK